MSAFTPKRLNLIGELLYAISKALPLSHRIVKHTMATLTMTRADEDTDDSLKFWLSEADGLEAGHRILFVESAETSNFEDYVSRLCRAVNQRVDSSKMSRLSKKIKPIFLLANSIAPITTSASQINPMPASLILGGITCILSFSSRVDDYQSRIIEMLEWMGDEVDLINQYRKDGLFKLHAEVESFELKIAADILRFCARVANMFYHKDGRERNGVIFALKAQCKDFDAKFGDIKTQFKSHLDALKNRRNLANTRNTHKMHDKIHAIGVMLDQQSSERKETLELQGEDDLRKENEERRRRLLSLIPSIDFGEIQENNFERRVPGSGDWLLQHPLFETWRASTTNDLLWILGKAGSGKSHLASRVISELGLNGGDDGVVPMAYAYCTSTQSKTRMTLNNLLGSILGQLYKYLPLSDGIENLLSKADVGNKEELSRTEMKEGIKSVLARLDSTFIVIDGLDECSHFADRQFEDLCSFLADLAKPGETGNSTKVLAFSRPDYKPINRAFCNFPQIRLDSGVNDGDIKTYISHTVDEINPDPSPEELAGFVDIKNLMFKHAGGLFLWVHFRAKQFKEIGTVEDIKEALEDTTEGLDELYGEEIRKVLNHPSRFVRDRALRALMWVTNSYRSLSKVELLEALAMKPQSKGLNRCQRLPRDFSISTECADLINEDHGFYRLRHASLRDFLLSELPVLQAYGSLQQEAHTIIAETCLTYANFEAFTSTSVASPYDLRELQLEYPLLDYAASFWGQHFAQATTVGKKRLNSLLMNVLGNETALRLSIQTIRFEEFERNLWFKEQPVALHALAIFNLAEVAATMDHLKTHLERRDDFGRFPIEYAILHSSKEMAIWILDRCREMAQDARKASDLSFLKTSRLPLLHNAAARNWDNIIRQLISLGLNQDECFGTGRTPLHRAVMARADRSVDCLLESGCLPDVVASNHESPLVAAARCKNTTAVRSLLRHEVDVNRRGEHEETALHWAARHGLVDMALDLLGRGADPNARMSPKPKFCGQTTLHAAVRAGSVEMTKVLISHGADVNAPCSWQADWPGETPLHLAVKFGSPEILDVLVRKGANIEATSAIGDTPFLLSCHFGKTRVTQCLLENGASITATDQATGRTGLHIAATLNHCSLIQLILETSKSNELVDLTDVQGETPLHYAARANNPVAARMLLGSGAQVDAISEAGETPLQLALSLGCTELAELLLRVYNASPSCPDLLGRMPIHHVSRHGRSDLLALVSRMTGVLLFDDNGFSPIHYAAEGNHLEYIKEVIAMFPDLDVGKTGDNSIAAIHIAAMSGSLDVVEYLIEVDPSCQRLKTDDLKLPTHHAAERGHLDCVKRLVESEAINSCDYQGVTPLWLASMSGHQPVVEYLLAKGADINKSDGLGSSPALIASMRRQTDIVCFLLDNGANPRGDSIEGGSLLHQSVLNGDEALVRRLLDSDPVNLEKNEALEAIIESALGSGRSEIIELFLQNETTHRILTDQRCRNPIFLVSQYATVSMLKRLAIEFPKAVGFVDKEGRDAMRCAASNGRADMIQPLCDLGVSINGSHGGTETPLERAVTNGSWKFVREAISQRATLNNEKSVSWQLLKRDPLLLATVCCKEKTTKVLLEHGADPTKRDWLGLCALDYAQKHPRLSAVFRSWTGDAYTPLDDATMSRNVREGIVKFLRTSINGESRVPRRQLLGFLSEALCALHTDDSISKALICQVDISTYHWQETRFVCDICVRYIRGPRWHCTVCADMDLCGTCHDDFRSSTPPGTLPDHVRVLKQLETDVFPVLEVLEVFMRWDVRHFAKALSLVGSLVDEWVDVRSEVYARWAAHSRSHTSWTPQIVPGWCLVKLIARVRDDWSDRKTGYLKEDDQARRLGLIRRELNTVYQVFNPREEHATPFCDGHRYLEIMRLDDLPEADARHFDDEGKLKMEFFQDMLDQYEKESQADIAGSCPATSLTHRQPSVPQEGSDITEDVECLHPRSRIPGRNEERLQLIEERLLQKGSEELAFETIKGTYEVAWKLAHAILGVSFTKPLEWVLS